MMRLERLNAMAAAELRLAEVPEPEREAVGRRPDRVRRQEVPVT